MRQQHGPKKEPVIIIKGSRQKAASTQQAARKAGRRQQQKKDTRLPFAIAILCAVAAIVVSIVVAHAVNTLCMKLGT